MTYVNEESSCDNAFMGNLCDKIEFSVIVTTDQYSAIELSSLTDILGNAS